MVTIKTIAIISLILLAGCIGMQNVKVYELKDGKMVMTKQVKATIFGTSGQKIKDKDISIEKKDTTSEVTGLVKEGISGSVTDAELLYLDATSSIQTQIDAVSSEWTDGGTYISHTEDDVWIGTSGTPKDLSVSGTISGAELTVSGNLDTQWFYNDGTKTYHKFSDGDLEISSSEANTVVQIGKNDALGSGTATLRFQDDSGAYLTEFIQDDGTLNIQAKTSASKVVVNDDATAANDFRVETGSNTHMLFVDGGLDGVGINNSSPEEELDVTGGVAISENLTIVKSLTVADVFISSAASPSGAVMFAVIDDTTGLVGKSALPYPVADGASSGASEWTDQGTYINHTEDDVYIGTGGTPKDLSVSGDVTVSGDWVFADGSDILADGNFYIDQDVTVGGDLTVEGTLWAAPAGYISDLTIDYVSNTSVEYGPGIIHCKDKLFYHNEFTTDTISNFDNDGWTYGYLDYSASTPNNPVFIDSTTDPVYNSTYKGLYNGDDRMIAAYNCDGAATIRNFMSTGGGDRIKFVATTYVSDPIKQLVTNGNPDSSWNDTTVDNTAYMPVGAIACLLRAQNTDNDSGVVIGLRSKQIPNSVSFSSSYNGADYTSFWADVAYPFDIEWFGSGDDDNSFNAYNLGYEIRR